MSANTTAAKAPKVLVTGRISSVDSWPVKNPKRFTTLVRLPAEDEFTTPATVEVLSEFSVGKEGEMFSSECYVGGRYRSYAATDKVTGEQRTVRTADNTLTVA